MVTLREIINGQMLICLEAYEGRELDISTIPDVFGNRYEDDILREPEYNEQDSIEDEVPYAMGEITRNKKTKVELVHGHGWGVWEDNNGMNKLALFLEIQLIDPAPYQRHQYEMTMVCKPVFTQWCYGVPWSQLYMVKAMRNAESEHMCSAVTCVVRRQAGKTEWSLRFFGAALLAFPSLDKSDPARYLLKSHIIPLAKGNQIRMQNWLLQKKKYLKGFTWTAKNGSLIASDTITLTNANNPEDVRFVEVPTSNIDGRTKVRMHADEFLKWREYEANSQILPMLQAGATFVMTSALRNALPWVQRWMKTATGGLVFMYNKAEICTKCLQELSFEKANECQHQRGVLAPYIDSEKLAGTAKMLSPTAVMMELRSVMPISGGAVFEESDLREKFLRVHPGDRNKHTGLLEEPVFNDYVAFCDPSMGSRPGEGSVSAMVIAGIRKKQGNRFGAYEIVLLSISHQPTSSTTGIVDFIVKCLRGFFQTFHHKSPALLDPGKQRAYVYLSVEQQSIPHTRELAKAIAEYPAMASNIIFIKSIMARAKKKNYEYGIADKRNWLHLRGGQGKRPDDERNYTTATIDALNSGLWSIHPNIITSNPFGGVNGALEAAISQMLNVRLVKIPGEKEKIVSAKRADGGLTGNDIWISICTMISNVTNLVTNSDRFKGIYGSNADLLSELHNYTEIQEHVLQQEEEDDDMIDEYKPTRYRTS